MATCELRNVLHVPLLVYSLVSVPTLAKSGLVVLFSDCKVTILRKDVPLATGTRIRGLYVLDLFNHPRGKSTALATASLQLWHERMAHVHPHGITPFHLWYGKAPDVAHLRVFGSRSWYKINAPGVDSLARRAKEAIMLATPLTRKPINSGT